MRTIYQHFRVRVLFAIVGAIATTMVMGCSMDTIHVEFVNDADKTIVGATDLMPDQLPDSLAIETSLQIKGSNWSVTRADPENKSDFIKAKKLKVFVLPVSSVPPGEIYFSLPTISNDIGGVAGEALPNENIFALHEDDWRQIEFVSTQFDRMIDEEVADIRRIYEQERLASGPFKKVHIRKRIVNPLAGVSLHLPELATLLHPVKKFVAVGFQRQRGTIPNSFAWKIDSTMTVWGVTDTNNAVHTLCVMGRPEKGSIDSASEAFATLNSTYNLKFVDWCRATKIDSDSQAFKEYFAPKN
jgi:hypothetical protein